MIKVIDCSPFKSFVAAKQTTESTAVSLRLCLIVHTFGVSQCEFPKSKDTELPLY